jgi:glycerophosphoryl diester phosphodiesterase
VLEAAVTADGARVPLLVEIKAPAATEIVLRILAERLGDDRAEIWSDPATAPAVLLSFHEEPLRLAQEVAPWIPRMRTTTATSPEWWESCRALEVAHAGVRIADARQADVERAAELGVALNLWTARTDEELERALELGCDTLTVDDPTWAAALMARHVPA